MCSVRRAGGYTPCGGLADVLGASAGQMSTSASAAAGAAAAVAGASPAFACHLDMRYSPSGPSIQVWVWPKTSSYSGKEGERAAVDVRH
jgi:hypothetical protein